MSARSSETTVGLGRPIPLEGTHAIPDWAWAQARTNFVIVTPSKSSPWRIVEPTVRGESSQAYSTVRYFLEQGDRRIRVKQYLHDWWIPTVSDISFRKPGRALVVGENVIFVGRDYRRHEAACGHRWGTGVELSVEAGTLTDEDWTTLWASLEAAEPSIIPQARKVPFAARNYWNRWNRVEAPWDSREISRLTWHEPTTHIMERARWAITADQWAVLPGVIDSLGFHPGPPEEVQAIFRSVMHLDITAWIRVQRKVSPSWRPLIDAGEVNRPNWTTLTIAGHAVERACMDPKVGNWYFAWRKGDVAYEMHLRAGAAMDERAAMRCVQALLS